MQDNETLITVSEDKEEWYSITFYCQKCHLFFMGIDTDWENDIHKEAVAKYCPYCGRKIIGFQKGNTTTFAFEENKQE